MKDNTFRVGPKEGKEPKSRILPEEIETGHFNRGIELLYPSSPVREEYPRILNLLHTFQQSFQEYPELLFSVPGRTEIGGNHTDHNGGVVIAAGVDLDILAAASRTENERVTLYSAGWDHPFAIDIHLLEPRKDERGDTSALIRGVLAGFKERGYAVGGCNVALHSRVLPGSGLSSSAAIEVFLGTLFSYFFNDNSLEVKTLAKIGQETENRYFGKPCGLMDQLACGMGAISFIDFASPDNPEIDRLELGFRSKDLILAVVNTGGSHADLTADYSAVPQEMKAVARFFGVPTLRALDKKEFFASITRLRKELGDRAILRAIHFFDENERVLAMKGALKKSDISGFLSLVRASGDSSWKLLQNIYSPVIPREQGITLGLTLANRILGKEGAARVHGGGFAGTIQAYIPKDRFQVFKDEMEAVFGKSSVTPLAIRQLGPFCIAH